MMILQNLTLFRKSREQRLGHAAVSCRLSNRRRGFHHTHALLKPCSPIFCEDLVFEYTSASFDDPQILKNKAEDVKKYLKGHCIYLVGMMGSGKTTIGKILSESLGYAFRDSDELIEQDVGGIAVAEIFKRYGESFFRHYETKVLQELSLENGLVVSTGGGAVIRPKNWTYMQKGITIWLDVPLKALARRITDCGTDSRPILHHGSGDRYSETVNIYKARGHVYAEADARVSLENIAAKLGLEDVCGITPTAIAIEVLVQIEKLLKDKGKLRLIR